jgi:hypothetical protein
VPSESVRAVVDFLIVSVVPIIDAVQAPKPPSGVVRQQIEPDFEAIVQ